jgi:hypothetical protein
MQQITFERDAFNFFKITLPYLKDWGNHWWDNIKMELVDIKQS